MKRERRYEVNKCGKQGRFGKDVTSEETEIERLERGGRVYNKKKRGGETNFFGL